MYSIFSLLGTSVLNLFKLSSVKMLFLSSGGFVSTAPDRSVELLGSFVCLER